jgi:dTDP-4-amino-4,6-dideoxygalactose transaminase
MKVTDLALFGALPAFERPLHVGQPNIGDRERLMDRFDQMLDRRWLSNGGPLVKEFEQRIAELVGVKHCIAICNATVALEIVIRALELSGEVIVPSFTFVATAHALQWQEITPVFAEIDPRTHAIDPKKVERLITPKTSAIIGVHTWGRPCAVDELQAIAKRRNLKLLFDAAHAFGASLNGRMIGQFGEAEVFSFHATKFLNSFEGGAVTTSNDRLAARIRLMQNFGFSGYDNVVYVGTNGKMTEASAAMGLTSLESIDRFVVTNKRNFDKYSAGLRELPGVKLLPYDEREKNNFQYIVLDIDAEAFGLTRDELLKVLHAENVLARRYFFPGCHRMEPYRSYFPHAGLLLPETEALCERIIALPTGTGVTAEQVAKICELIACACQHADAIRDQLSAAAALAA